MREEAGAHLEEKCSRQREEPVQRGVGRCGPRGLCSADSSRFFTGDTYPEGERPPPQRRLLGPLRSIGWQRRPWDIIKGGGGALPCMDQALITA